MSAEIQPYWEMSDEDLISLLGQAMPDKHGLAAMVHRILDYRRARDQADAAKALLQAANNQAVAGDALVGATADLVGATRQLAHATRILGVITAFLVLVAALQAYAMFKWHP